ncbi:putative membrane protein SC4H8.02 [Carbonactinospora thermoautotrophica]|uniref:Putative membrane protein SC4H8.02 n=1 Tax=Carbonactinospora thermoautotrophica TaxID=1469144 RepID=A0A132MSL8_9ACTN|nr:putative membrane protein SC4H8.02 [Carbonactinospora thermoautotrophica]
MLRDALGIGVATGAYALSFGALGTAAGLSVTQTCATSVLMFTGASQYALVGILGAGGSPLAGAATAVLLGARNALYGLRLSQVLGVRGGWRLVAAQLVLDESSAMAVGRASPLGARLGFWATGLAVYLLWNLGTLLGALGAQALPDPRALGLDAAAPAAFLALMAPRLTGREPWLVASAAGLVAMASVPLVPAGVPVLLAALVAVVAGARPSRAARREERRGASAPGRREEARR